MEEIKKNNSLLKLEKGRRIKDNIAKDARNVFN